MGLNGNKGTNYPYSYNDNGCVYNVEASCPALPQSEAKTADWGYNIEWNNTRPWRTLWKTDLSYILKSRKTLHGYRFAKAKVNNNFGLLIFPDDWDPANYEINNVNQDTFASYSANTISSSDWTNHFQNNGVVFLKANGYVNSNSQSSAGTVHSEDDGYYWTCDTDGRSNDAYCLYFNGAYLTGDVDFISVEKCRALNVRLAANVQYSALSY